MRHILKPFAIILIKILQRKYKKLTKLALNGAQTNQNLNKLRLYQNLLYYFQNCFSAWGYFHPSPVWSKDDAIEFALLFPEKDFEEVEIVKWYNPYAVTYYRNKIYKYEQNVAYGKEIERQLRMWKQWRL